MQNGCDDILSVIFGRRNCERRPVSAFGNRVPPSWAHFSCGTPHDEYHGEESCTTFPDHDSPAPLFVLLFDDNFSYRLESLAIMCLVREKAAIEVLKSEMDKGCSFNFSNQGGFTAVVDGRELPSGSTIVLGDASYKKTPRVPADTWNAEDGQFVVECVKVMLGMRIKVHVGDIKIKLPARLVQGKTWALT